MRRQVTEHMSRLNAERYMKRVLKVLEQARETATMTGRRIDSNTLRYLRLLAARPWDDSIYDMLKREIELQSVTHRLREIPFLEPDVELDGDIEIGKTPAGKSIKVPQSAFTQHMLQIASTGSGKSTLLRRIRLQIAPKVQGIWTFDFFKSQERHLLPFYEQAGREYVVCHWSRLKINDLQPVENEPPIEFIMRWTDIYKTSFNASEAAEAFLRDSLVQLFKEFGIFNGSRNYPTILDLAEQIKKMHGHPSMKTSILNHLNAIILGIGEEGVSYSQGWSIGKLAEMNICFEFRGLSHSLQTYRCKVLIGSLFAYRVYNSALDSGLQTLVDFDEGHRLYQGSSGDYIATMTGLVRGTGIGLMVSTQTHDVDRSIRVNSALKIMGRLNDHQDITAFGRSLGLDSEQIEWCKVNLKPGVNIVKMSFGNWQYPMVCYVPNFELPAVVTESSLEESCRVLGSLPVVKRKQREESIGIAISKQELLEESFIHHLYDNPRLSSTQHYTALGLSMRQGTKLRNELLRRGLITEWRAETGKRGKAITLLYPSEKWLKERRMKAIYKNRGGFLHWYYLDTARIFYEKMGYEVCWEKQVNGKFVDLVVHKNGTLCAVECQLKDVERAIQNMSKCLDAGLEVELLCGSKRFLKQVEEKARRRFNETESSRIHFRTLSDYMD